MTTATRRAVFPAMAVAAVLVLAGCGGGDDETDGNAQEPQASSASPADQAAITGAAVKVVTSDDKASKNVCRNLLTKRFVTTVFKTQKKCQEPSELEPGDLATGAAVTSISVEGDAGRATVTEEGGLTAGATGEWRFVRDGAKWRVDEWSVDYLRSGFSKLLENHKPEGASDPLGNPAMNSCMRERIASQDEATFLANSYAAFQEDEKADQFYVDFLLDCGKTEASPGVSLLRTVFEDGLRAELGEQLPPAVLDCFLKDLRTRISESEVQNGYRSDAQTPAVSKKVEQAVKTCARTAGA